MEEIIYSQALKEYGLNKTGDNVWSKPEAVLWYQNKCEKVIRNLDYRECNWRKGFDDNDPNHILQQLTKDDDKVKLVKKRKNENFTHNVIRQQQRPKGIKPSLATSNSQLNINSSTESVSKLNDNNNKAHLPVLLPVPSFYGFNNENDNDNDNDGKVLSNDILDYSNIAYPITSDDYDLGFNFDDDTNLPDFKSPNNWATQSTEIQVSLQEQREREREQRLAREQTVEIDNNMLDLIMDI
jgi:hypothetical protein